MSNSRKRRRQNRQNRQDSFARLYDQAQQLPAHEAAQFYAHLYDQLQRECDAPPRPEPGVYAHLYDQVQPTGNANPRKLGGSIVGPGGPRDRAAVVLDLTDCVLLDDCVVATVDAVRDGHSTGKVIYMTLAGRVNKTTDRAQVGYMFGSDGAAAIITELLALADRWGTGLLDDITRRLTDLHQGKAVDLHWLRAAIDNVIADQDEIAADTHDRKP